MKQHQRLKKGRNREKGDIIWSFNIRSTLDSVISDGGHRLRANGFKLRPLPVAYSNAIPSPPFHITSFTLLAHYGFWSFEYPAGITTTGAPSFVSSLTFRTTLFTSQPRRNSLSRWQTLQAQPQGFFGPTLERITGSICGEAYDTSSALIQMTPLFRTVPQRDRSCVIASREVLNFDGCQYRI